MVQREMRGMLEAYLKEFPGDTICVRQAWYEGLGGQGVASPEDVAAMEEIMDSLADWTHIGDVRYEKFGNQNSWKRK